MRQPPAVDRRDLATMLGQAIRQMQHDEQVLSIGEYHRRVQIAKGAGNERKET